MFEGIIDSSGNLVCDLNDEGSTIQVYHDGYKIEKVSCKVIDGDTTNTLYNYKIISPSGNTIYEYIPPYISAYGAGYMETFYVSDNYVTFSFSDGTAGIYSISKKELYEYCCAPLSLTCNYLP